MSGLLPDPGLTVAVMGICIQSSGGHRCTTTCSCPPFITPFPAPTHPPPPHLPTGLIWMFVSGFSMATSTRVSNSLGAGRPKAARLVTWTGGAIGVGLELAFMAAVVLLRHHWAFLFTGAGRGGTTAPCSLCAATLTSRLPACTQMPSPSSTSPLRCSRSLRCLFPATGQTLCCKGC